MNIKLAIKIFILCQLFVGAFAALTLQKAEVKVLNPTTGNCSVKIHPTKPKTVDYDVHANRDAKDVLLRFGAFSMIDGVYNEVIETEEISICNMANSKNPLVTFMLKEMQKVGNLTSACPITKGYYYMHGFTLYESDVPIPLPSGNFKIEVNGTLHENDDTLTPLFVAEIYFSEE